MEGRADADGIGSSFRTVEYRADTEYFTSKFYEDIWITSQMKERSSIFPDTGLRVRHRRLWGGGGGGGADQKRYWGLFFKITNYEVLSISGDQDRSMQIAAIGLLQYGVWLQTAWQRKMGRT